MSDNKLGGVIPTALCQMTELRKYLEACITPLDSLCRFSHLSVSPLSSVGALFLDTNDLVGSVPACMDSLTHLRQLYLFNNDLTGVLPEGLEGLTSLRKSIAFENINIFLLDVHSHYSRRCIVPHRWPWYRG